jgi:hypothetical protein
VHVSAVLLKAVEPVRVTDTAAVAEPPVLARVKVWTVA